jgi:hypothetical protein
MKISEQAVRFIMEDQMQLVNRRLSERNRNRRIVSDYGFLPGTVSRTWNELVVSNNLPTGAQVKYILWFLSYMKNYNAYESHCSKFAVAPSTYREWVWKFALAIASMEHIVSFVNYLI